MIKLGKVKEMAKIQGLGKDVQSKVEELLKILDSEYGEDRDIDKDWGGFIAIIEEEQDFEVLKKEYYLDVEVAEPEWSMEINELWEEHLFVMNSEYSIVVVGIKDKLRAIRGE